MDKPKNEIDALVGIGVIALALIGTGVALVVNIGVASIVVGSILGIGALARLMYKYLNGEVDG